MTKPEVKDVVRFFKKLTILLVLLFLVDRGLGTLIEKAYDNSPQGDMKTFAHSVNTPTEDVMIFGSSRAVHGYDSEIFADSLHLTTFNSARENSTILYHYVVLKSMLRKHTPKIIILDITPRELTWRAEENSKLVLASMILPYVRRDTAFANIAKELFNKELVKAEVSKLYAYNSLILPILFGRTGNNKANKEEILNGYLPLHGNKVKKDLPVFDPEDGGSDSTAKAFFEDFIHLAKEKHIKLYIIQSPLYITPFKSSPSLRDMEAIMNKYNVPFWDYAFDTTFFKRENFYDNIHLNDKGAKEFSKKIASEIKKDIEQQQNVKLTNDNIKAQKKPIPNNS